MFDFMKLATRSIAGSNFAMRRIVSALAVGMLGLGGLTFSVQSHAQTHDILADKMDITSEKPQYELPKQKLTYEITAYQILSDLALTRGQLKVAYHGYMSLAQKTRDPRYAERAYIVAALADDTTSALLAAQLLKTLAPNATLGDSLVEQMALASILKKSESGELQSAYQDTKAFLKKHPKHEVGLTLLADIAHKLGYEDDKLSAFEQLYAISPNDADTINNLGYYLADHNIRLDEAEKLIKRALKIAPHAPHIIDSAAWLAYRQGKLSQALKLSRSAVAASPAPDIQLHLAEILWVSNAAGERAEAQQLFAQLQQQIAAKNDATLSKELNATMRRLGVNIVPSKAP